MEHGRYMPKDDAGKNQWLKNFSSKLGGYAADLELDSAEVIYMEKASAFFNYILLYALFLDNYKSGVTKYKNLLRDESQKPIGDVPLFLPPTAPEAVAPGIFERVSRLVATIKSRSKYSETIGKNLGIIGTEVTVDFSTVKPLLHTELRNGHVYLSWLKDHAHAVDIKADYGDGNGFINLGRITRHHFTDSHLPASGTSQIYKYMIRYVFHDEEVGEWSNEVSITVTGI